jgi:hypothetical protein
VRAKDETAFVVVALVSNGRMFSFQLCSPCHSDADFDLALKVKARRVQRAIRALVTFFTSRNMHPYLLRQKNSLS